MKLGDLTLIHQSGLFLREQVMDMASLERDPERLEVEHHLTDFNLECGAMETELLEPVPVLPITPVEIRSEGDYISGSFKDSGLATGPYTVKVWLMIEESEPLDA